MGTNWKESRAKFADWTNLIEIEHQQWIMILIEYNLYIE